MQHTDFITKWIDKLNDKCFSFIWFTKKNPTQELLFFLIISFLIHVLSTGRILLYITIFILCLGHHY